MLKGKVLISTSTFGACAQSPARLLSKLGFMVVLNPFKRKLAKNETLTLLKDCCGIIAGTEVLDKEVLREAVKLKVISRIGVGVDNIDLVFAKNRGIRVFNTPEAVTESVAELAVGLILDCLRGISHSDREMKNGKWTDPAPVHFGTNKIISEVSFSNGGRKAYFAVIDFDKNDIIISYSQLQPDGTWSAPKAVD